MTSRAAVGDEYVPFFEGVRQVMVVDGSEWVVRIESVFDPPESLQDVPEEAEA